MHGVETRVAKLIPDFSEWPNLRQSAPYTWHLGDAQKLYYFGGNHSRDPSNHQFPVLLDFWRSFLATTDNTCVVLVEGGLRPVWRTMHEAISNDSEAGAITHLAHQQCCAIRCPEPSESYQIDLLQKEFSAEIIAYYFLVRLVHVWYRTDKTELLQEFVNKRLPKPVSDQFSFMDLYKIHRELFQDELAIDDPDFFGNILSPLGTDSPINEVARLCSRLRNIYIVTEIERTWQRGFSVFAVFGLSHAVFQEPALRKILAV